MFLGLNVSLANLDHSLFRDFRRRRIPDRGTVLTSSWLRRDAVWKIATLTSSVLQIPSHTVDVKHSCNKVNIALVPQGRKMTEKH